MARERWRDMSDCEIAREANVSPTHVGKIRKALIHADNSNAAIKAGPYRQGRQALQHDAIEAGTGAATQRARQAVFRYYCDVCGGCLEDPAQ